MVKPTFGQRIMARGLRVFEHTMDESYDAVKQKLFSSLKKADRILEIGPGTGVNFKYYPKGARVIAIEPNPLLCKDIEQKANRYNLKLTFYQSVAEDLPVLSGSVDVVVSTLVLCSVHDVIKSLKEIKRVLKKGGKFLCIEHVLDECNSFRRIVQHAVRYTGWTVMSDGCHPNRALEHFIYEAGFKKIKLYNYYQQVPALFGWVIKSHIAGTAVK